MRIPRRPRRMDRTSPEGGSLLRTARQPRHRHRRRRPAKSRLLLKRLGSSRLYPPRTHRTLSRRLRNAAHEAPTTPPVLLYRRRLAGQQVLRTVAVRIEQDIRQDCAGYDTTVIKSGVDHLLQAYPQNRLVKHLAENCALSYNCPAARNFFMGRWECPIPTSPACNANCIGCSLLFQSSGRDDPLHPVTASTSSHLPKRSSSSPSPTCRKHPSRS